MSHHHHKNSTEGWTFSTSTPVRQSIFGGPIYEEKSPLIAFIDGKLRKHSPGIELQMDCGSYYNIEKDSNSNVKRIVLYTTTDCGFEVTYTAQDGISRLLHKTTSDVYYDPQYVPSSIIFMYEWTRPKAGFDFKGSSGTASTFNFGEIKSITF